MRARVVAKRGQDLPRQGRKGSLEGRNVTLQGRNVLLRDRNVSPRRSNSAARYLPPQQRLYFCPLPHEQGAFGVGRGSSRTGS